MPTNSPGTNLHAWLVTILRNTFYTQVRCEQRFAELGENSLDQSEALDEPQTWKIRAKEIGDRFVRLSAEQCDAMMLVAVNGYSYEQAARVLGCKIGTTKSRVSRARAELSAGTSQRHHHKHVEDLDNAA